MAITIKKNILTNNDCYRAGATISPNSMQLHTIGTPQNSASALASYWNQPGIGACVHYCVDAETEGTVYQFLPDNRRSWADGGYGNSNSITVELMESDYMTYTGGANYTVTNEAKFKADVTRAYNTAVQFFAMKCKEYGWNPQEKMSNGLHRVFSHDEGRRLGLSTSHVDPVHIWNRYGWTMDQFRADVAKAMGGVQVIQPTSTATVDNFYRVRKSWEDAKSQLGAYTVLQNAKDNCPEGYHVYDSNGKVVYTPATKSYDQLTAKDVHGTEAEKIAKVASIYQEVMKKTGMLASVGLAQFCLESGFGTTDLAINANNMHGMKCSLSGNTWSGSTWDGVSKYTKQTAEQTASGQVYYITADFRKYPTIMKSVEDRAAYFIGAMNGSAKRFPNINMIQDAKTQVSLIKAGGYATDVNYVSKLMSLIERFNLTQYDKGITPEVWSKAPAKTTTVAPTTSLSYYRVAKSYANGVYTGQVGAYSSKDNALKTAKERQLVAFNPDGSVLADYTPKSGYYRVAKSYTNGSYVGQVGAYTNKDNALKTAKEKQLVAFNPDGSVLADYTPKPVKTGTKTVTMASLLLEKCKEMNDQMLADIKAGIKWKYSNTKKLSPTFAKARSSKNYYCNCAKMPLWALKMLGVVPESAEGFYGRRDGKLIFKSTETKKAIQAACDIININMKKTVNQAIKDGTLQPGDIVTYYNPLQHTNIYAGNKKWYDSGHAYGGGSGEAPFKTWYGNTVYGTAKISHIIRLRGTKIVTTVDTNQYRVQVGSYLLKDNADNMFNIVKRTGLDVKIVKYDGEYVVQLEDLFSTRADAEKLVATAAAKGIKTIVKEV